MIECPRCKGTGEVRENSRPYGNIPPHVRASLTSRAAAEAFVLAQDNARRRVYEELRSFGPSCDELLAEVLGMPQNTLRPRRCELVEMGLVRDSGMTTNLRSGRRATLWEATTSE